MELYKTLQKKYSNKKFYLCGRTYGGDSISFITTRSASSYGSYESHNGKISEHVICNITIQSALQTISYEFDSEEYDIYYIKPNDVKVGTNNGEIQFFIERRSIAKIDRGELDKIKFAML